MTYTDAKEYLHIAENAYNVEAYGEAADILRKVTMAVAYDKEMPESQRDELVKLLRQQIGRFQSCPDECCWEDVCGLNDYLRD